MPRQSGLEDRPDHAKEPRGVSGSVSVTSQRVAISLTIFVVKHQLEVEACIARITLSGLRDKLLDVLFVALRTVGYILLLLLGSSAQGAPRPQTGRPRTRRRSEMVGITHGATYVQVRCGPLACGWARGRKDGTASAFRAIKTVLGRMEDKAMAPFSSGLSSSSSRLYQILGRVGG